MKTTFFIVAGILSSFTLSAAKADLQKTEFVCTFEAVGIQMDTMKESEVKNADVIHSKAVYRVKLGEMETDFFNQDGAERRVAIVQKGYLNSSGVFKATQVQTHEVVKTTESLLRNNVTKYDGDFFQLKIENRDEFPARVYFDGIGNGVNTSGKCVEN
jgi:hypothetical protein